MEDSEDMQDVAAPELTATGLVRPNPAQRHYLARGLDQPGGKLPLFDEYGQHVHPALVKACIAHGWAEPWFGNPLKPDWLICRLTDEGRRVVQSE
ncbi:MAG: hypothetical protein RJB62_509 [Pseudomonadota bacterium]|jgi:hypothetical protein